MLKELLSRLNVSSALFKQSALKAVHQEIWANKKIREGLSYSAVDLSSVNSIKYFIELSL